MKENSIGEQIEEKYTRYLNCETDTLELTIEEAIFILETDESVHYVEDLLQKAYKVVLSDYKRALKENEKKNKIKEQKECTFREYGAEEGLWYCSNCHDEWLFYEGTPEENNLKYCPHCGAKVIKYESYIETEIEIANKMVKDSLKEREEEKEAIENIKGLEILFEIDDEKDFEATPLVQKEIAKDLKILLNLIDKMKNCINILDDELKERNKKINEKEIIIEKLQKDNEELKEFRRRFVYSTDKELQEANEYFLNRYTFKSDELAVHINTLLKATNSSIPVKKIKDKISERQFELQQEYKDFEDDAILIALQELLEGRK